MLNPKSANRFMILVLFFIIVVTSGILVFLIMLFPTLKNDNNMWLVQVIGSLSYFVIPTIIYKYFKKVSFKELLYLDKISFKNVALVILISLSMQPMLSLIGAVTDIFSKNEIQDTITSFMQMPYWKVLLAVAIIPAITEEMVFRGAILKGYENATPIIALLIPSFYFGIMHFTITQLFYAMAGGIVFSYLVRSTRSIWSSIIAHFVLNGTQITLSYILYKFYPQQSIEGLDMSSAEIFVSKIVTTISAFVTFIFTLPLFILFMYLFVKNNKKINENIQEENLQNIDNKIIKKEKVFSVSFFLVVIIWALYSVKL